MSSLSVFSLVALVVVLSDMSFQAGMTVLVITELIHASLQLFLLIHVKENSGRKSLYKNVNYALFVGVVTIFGTLFGMLLGYNMV